MNINGFANGKKSDRDAALHSMREQDEAAEFSVESSTKELEEFEARLERHNPGNNDNGNKPVDEHKEEKVKNSNAQAFTQGQHPSITSNTTARRTENNLQPAMSEMHVQRPAHKPRLTEEELERRLERQQDIADVRKLSNEENKIK